MEYGMVCVNMMHGIYVFLIMVAYEETEEQNFEAFSQSRQIQWEEGGDYSGPRMIDCEGKWREHEELVP